MANVDFTLDDVREVVSEIVEEKVSRIVDEKVNIIIDEKVPNMINVAIKASEDRMGEFLTHQFGLIYDRFDVIDRRFEAMDKRFDRLEVRVGSVETELKGYGRLVRKNSADIAMLQSAQGM